MTDSTQKLRKDTAVLTNDRYKTPTTSMLIYHFEPTYFDSIDSRLKTCSIEQLSIEGKDIYLFDHFFSSSEGRDMLDYSRTAKFSRRSYASHESKEEGEEPALSMNNKEKWEFFAKPPQAIKEVYNFLGHLAYCMHADITTLPWDLCDQNICASAVATNKIEKVAKTSMEMGKHTDYSTEEGMPFGIPNLCASAEEIVYHPSTFHNGDRGKPWLVSIMVYATDEKFLPEYGMGTVFCDDSGKILLRADCRHMRFVFFEGDIIHSIEESKVPPDISVWRVSYVFKLMINPKKDQSMKEIFHGLMNSYKTSPTRHA